MTNIQNWLSCFGEVISEITEEQFEMEGLDPKLPPVGNGIYNVKMKITKELPNWIPMYGRKICLEYPGVKRQCSSCYGPHAKKYCRSERCGMESFVIGFSKKYTAVPAEFYGRLSHLANLSEVVQSTEGQATRNVPNATGGGERVKMKGPK